MKNKWVALGLCIFGSVLGLHHYYLGDYKKGIIFTLTAGGFGIWWVHDIIMIISNDDFIDNYELDSGNRQMLGKIDQEQECKKEESIRIMKSKPNVTNKKQGYKEYKEYRDSRGSRQVGCPRCGSTQITANKKGFSLGKALVGSAVTLPLGAVTGMIGKNKILITCLSCGKQFKPGR